MSKKKRVTYELANVEVFLVKVDGAPVGMVVRNLQNNHWTPLKKTGHPLEEKPSRKEATEELLRWTTEAG